MPKTTRSGDNVIAEPSQTTGPDLAYITPALLSWAIARSLLSRRQVAAKLKVGEDRILEWEKGTPPPFEKARAAAKLLQCPFGYLFLPEPPPDTLPLPDRRRLGPNYRPSPAFLQLLNDVLVRQDWYEDYLKATGRPTKRQFVGSFAVSAKEGDVAASIRETIKIQPQLRHATSSHSEYLNALVRNAEDVGILVMRSSVVGNATSRPISTDEMQGFAIAHPIAPLVFINSGDFKAAQVFTFAHELAHIWIGQSAITKTDEMEPDEDRIELFCNRVAVEALVPSSEFKAVWDATRPERRLDEIPRRFWVSSFVVLRRAYELERLSAPEYHDMRVTEVAKLKRGKKSSGGDFYRTLFVRMGNTFTQAVVGAVVRDNVLIRDAARLLSVSPKTLTKVVEVTK